MSIAVVKILQRSALPLYFNMVLSLDTLASLLLERLWEKALSFM